MQRQIGAIPEKLVFFVLNHQCVCGFNYILIVGLCHMVLKPVIGSRIHEFINRALPSRFGSLCRKWGHFIVPSQLSDARNNASATAVAATRWVINC